MGMYFTVHRSRRVRGPDPRPLPRFIVRVYKRCWGPGFAAPVAVCKGQMAAPRTIEGSKRRQACWKTADCFNACGPKHAAFLQKPLTPLTTSAGAGERV